MKAIYEIVELDVTDIVTTSPGGEAGETPKEEW